MGRQILPLTVDRLSLIVDPCSACTFWELTPMQTERFSLQAVEAKRGWLTAALLEWGTPGKIALVDGAPAGYVTFAPAHLVPRALAFPTAPVSEDAIVLLTARIAAQYAGQGLGRVLIQTAAKDALRRGITALEAFATTRPRHLDHPDPRIASKSDSAGGTPSNPDTSSRTWSVGGAPTPRSPGSVSAFPMGVPDDQVAPGRLQRQQTCVPGSGPQSQEIDAEPPELIGTERNCPDESLRSPLLEEAGAEVLSGAPGAPRAKGRPSAGPNPDRPQRAARAEPTHDPTEDPETPRSRPEDDIPHWPADHCLLPVDFLTAVGFSTVRDHPVYPRMRLDLRTALRWLEELESAVERLFSPVRSLGRRQPIGSMNRTGISSPPR